MNNILSYSYSFIPLILFYVTSKTFSTDPPSSPNSTIIPSPPPNATTTPSPTPSEARINPGSSSCSYYGRIHKECNFPPIGADKLPKECSSFVYDGLTVSDTWVISDSYGGDVGTYVKDLARLGKPIFLFYGYPSNDVWFSHISEPMGFENETKSLQAFLNENKGITGFIIKNLYLYIYGDSNGLNADFKMYLDHIRRAFPDLTFGVQANGTLIIDNCGEPNNCFDFAFLDPSIDFYAIDITEFNNCTDKFKCGTYPFSDSGHYSLNYLGIWLKKANIPSSKVYFYFRGNPTRPGDFNICSTTYDVLCTSPEDTTNWCWDTQKALVDKGEFMKANGVGFIIQNIDFVDPFNVCKCDHPFSSFYFTLNGFNGSTANPCPLFDGSCAK